VQIIGENELRPVLREAIEPVDDFSFGPIVFLVLAEEQLRTRPQSAGQRARLRLGERNKIYALDRGRGPTGRGHLVGLRKEADLSIDTWVPRKIAEGNDEYAWTTMSPAWICGCGFETTRYRQFHSRRRRARHRRISPQQRSGV